MKKFAIVLAIAMLMASMISVTAFAHGGHGRGHHARTNANPTPRYAACTVEGCATLGLHQHDGTYYYCANHTAGHGCGRLRNR